MDNKNNGMKGFNKLLWNQISFRQSIPEHLFYIRANTIFLKQVQLSSIMNRCKVKTPQESDYQY